MEPPTVAAALAALPRPDTGLGVPELWLGAALLLGLLGFFATLRQALLSAAPSRVLEAVRTADRRPRIASLLERADSLATSARVLEITCGLVFLLLVLALVTGVTGEDGARVDWGAMGAALVISVPLILLVGEALPALLVRPVGERLLVRVLPAFRLVQLPIALLVRLVEALQRVAVRTFGLRFGSASERRLLADLRHVIEESPVERELDETERELIENVMEFRDVDAAEIMTPRTEISAVDVGLGLDEAARAVALCGHSRVPVYRENLDTIVGFLTARDVLRARGEERSDLASVLRPAYFVPETKRVSELLTEFRKEHLKMAVVLDEYGGTAGIVTMGDILGELVGDIPDEFDAREPAPVQPVSPGVFDVDASLRVSEVNEELELSLPEEEDYETLGGFVLAELGRFPKPGESFEWDGSAFSVVEANDRRVLVVRVRPLAAERAG